jgi:hypothetical protein
MEQYKTKLQEYEKPNGKKLSDKSIDLYVRNIKMLVDKHGYDWKIDNLKDFFKSKNFTLETSKNYMNSIINYLKVFEYKNEIIKIYILYRDELEKQIQEKPKLTDKKKLNLVDWSDIIKWYNLIKKDNQLKYDLKKLSRNDLQMELLLCMYISYPRRNELATLKYLSIDDDFSLHTLNKDFNYLLKNHITGENTIVLNNFKTKEQFNQQVFEIPEELTELNMLIDKLVLDYNIDGHNGESLFIDTKGNPLTTLNLTKTLQRSSKKYLEGKSLSTNMIRHSFNETKYKDIKDELIKDSYLMGHSVGVKLNYYIS